LQELASMLRYT